MGETKVMDDVKGVKIVLTPEGEYLWWFMDNDFAQGVPTCAEFGVELEVIKFEVDVPDWLCMREALWAVREGLA
jgi:hypothetical protein